MLNMSQNIVFNIKYSDVEEYKSVDFDNLLFQINTDMLTEDNYTALLNHYELNFTKKQLLLITEYYMIGKRNMNKDEIVQIISLYETNPDNADIVNERKKLWLYLNELKSKDFFKKYICFDV
jgi:hypothetical protein